MKAKLCEVCHNGTQYEDEDYCNQCAELVED